jgi:hypothetical protein
MTIGHPAVFAVESRITRAYERLSLRALGFFTIHIQGQTYGVRSPDASMLACSFDAVTRRIADRGSHSASFAEEDAGILADSVLQAIFGEEQPGQSFFSFTQEQFSDLVYSRHLIWAPDGDEAFDDGSLSHIFRSTLRSEPFMPAWAVRSNLDLRRRTLCSGRVRKRICQHSA